MIRRDLLYPYFFLSYYINKWQISIQRIFVNSMQPLRKEIVHLIGYSTSLHKNNFSIEIWQKIISNLIFIQN